MEQPQMTEISGNVKILVRQGIKSLALCLERGEPRLSIYHPSIHAGASSVHTAAC
jgi:hypothetical protein